MTLKHPLHTMRLSIGIGQINLAAQTFIIGKQRQLSEMFQRQTHVRGMRGDDNFTMNETRSGYVKNSATRCPLPQALAYKPLSLRCDWFARLVEKLLTAKSRALDGEAFATVELMNSAGRP